MIETDPGFFWIDKDPIDLGIAAVFSLWFSPRREVRYPLGMISEANIYLRPLGDRMIVQRKAAVEKTEGGIVIPDQAQEAPMEGTVLRVGHEVNEGQKPSVQLAGNGRIDPGDMVLFASYCGTEITDEQTGQTYLVLARADVLAVREPREPEVVE